MWLIDTETLRLHAFVPPDLPPYAILSHTWGLGEVTFQGFSDLNAAKGKAGYIKIQRTCELARRNGLGWAWVDTCCIDKSSSAELSEAINSMFESSVLRQLSAMAGVQGKTARVVKNSAAITEVSIAKRMSWASKRRTTRVEDMAYCLLGLFRVNMPLLYGEGTRSFMQLQEEILKNSTDMSLFYWTALQEASQSYRGLLARHPSEFASWYHIESTSRKSISWAVCEQEKEFSSTNKGVRMDATLASLFVHGVNRTCLRCTLFPDDYVVFIPLRYHRDNIYVRELATIIISSHILRHEQETIYIAKDVDERMSTNLQAKVAETLSIDRSLLPANFSLEVTETWPKNLWLPQRQRYALPESKLFYCITSYSIYFGTVEVGDVCLICQRHSSALQPLRYALIPLQEATGSAGLLSQIRDHDISNARAQPVEALSLMEQFIIDGRQAVEILHGDLSFSLFVTRYSETEESANTLFSKVTSSQDLLHPLPIKKRKTISIGDSEGPGHRLEGAPQIGGDGAVVQPPNPSDIAEAERENST
ncbi:HET domain-containing protein [Colletotrichum salicis]|uniref:HET domain-containing protein n=1 Tax=Colletotrichum salicis TaxID=1209931 RepID=A0A135UAF4_9PEZI|nr:HET domain-containing protein [Colletotrichum salicis]